MTLHELSELAHLIPGVKVLKLKHRDKILSEVGVPYPSNSYVFKHTSQDNRDDDVQFFFHSAAASESLDKFKNLAAFGFETPCMPIEDANDVVEGGDHLQTMTADKFISNLTRKNNEFLEYIRIDTRAWDHSDNFVHKVETRKDRHEFPQSWRWKKDPVTRKWLQLDGREPGLAPDIDEYYSDPFNNDYYAGGNLREQLELLFDNTPSGRYTVPPQYREGRYTQHPEMEVDGGGVDDDNDYEDRLEAEADIKARIEAGEDLSEDEDTE